MGDLGYEIYVKEFASRSSAPTITLAGKLGRITLNRSAAEMFDKDAIQHVLLLWDKDSLKFAIRPLTKKDDRAFNIRYSKKDKQVIGAAFSGVMFLRHIGYDFTTTGTYPLTWNADISMFEVQLPKERFGASQRPLLAVEGGKKHGKAANGD